MTGYNATKTGPPHNPARPDDEAIEEAEALDISADDLDQWRDWLAQARDAITAGGGDCDDVDDLVPYILNCVAAETTALIAAAEKRANAFAVGVLRFSRDSNLRLAHGLRALREEREERIAETTALAGRLDKMDEALAAVTRENIELKAKVVTQETEFARKTAGLSKELSRERALRRLLDAQRSRPHTQRVASELAKKHAAKALAAAVKTKTEVTIQ
jgi:hypothetical protein